MRQKVGPVQFDPVHPARAAGSKEWEVRSSLESTQQFGAFLHDREIGSEICVENVIEPKFAQRIDQSARADSSRLQTELLADSDTGRRGDLYDGYPPACIECVKHVVPVRVFNERPHRTNQSALTAGNAICLAQRPVEDGHGSAVEAPVGKTNDILLLDAFSANFCTKPAFDAF